MTHKATTNHAVCHNTKPRQNLAELGFGLALKMTNDENVGPTLDRPARQAYKSSLRLTHK
jgi:hypothetical protein